MIKRCILLVLVSSLFAAAAPIQWKAADGGNDHYYEYFRSVSIFNGFFSFNTAKANAESSSYLGLNGYLLTVTSAAENEFIRTSFPFLFDLGKTSNLWLAASDAQVDGQYRWVSGPEAGQLLAYSNFATPPVAQGTSNFAAMVINAVILGAPTTARWTEYDATNRTLGCAVEYGGTTPSSNAVLEPSSCVFAASSLLALAVARSRWYPKTRG
ncbi:MAG: hypothetical protein FJW36_19995 [Acidobacteria bacterium]|nr:hypothetical protein [Acidobacteriota bacterium]